LKVPFATVYSFLGRETPFPFNCPPFFFWAPILLVYIVITSLMRVKLPLFLLLRGELPPKDKYSPPLTASALQVGGAPCGTSFLREFFFFFLFFCCVVFFFFFLFFFPPFLDRSRSSLFSPPFFTSVWSSRGGSEQSHFVLRYPISLFARFLYTLPLSGYFPATLCCRKPSN